MPVVPTGSNGEKVELNEKQELMLLKKDELSEMVIASKLKYKKLETKNKNTNKANKETEGIIEEAAETIKLLSQSVEIANEEAAAMSESLLIKNRMSREVNEVVVDMIHAVDLVLKNSMKLLEMNGVLIGGKQ